MDERQGINGNSILPSAQVTFSLASPTNPVAILLALPTCHIVPGFWVPPPPSLTWVHSVASNHPSPPTIMLNTLPTEMPLKRKLDHSTSLLPSHLQ